MGSLIVSLIGRLKHWLDRAEPRLGFVHQFVFSLLIGRFVRDRKTQIGPRVVPRDRANRMLGDEVLLAASAVSNVRPPSILRGHRV